MNPLSNIWERLNGWDLEQQLGLRPAYPAVAIELDRREAVLVRLKRRRRGRPLLEARQVRQMGQACVPASLFQNDVGPAEELRAKLRELFEASGTRPGRVSLVLPDNLAKVSLLTLPDWPPSRRQLEQIIRFKMRKAVPFRLDEANLSYQVLSSEPKEISILVALVRRSLLEQYEKALAAMGARVGLVDLCTPNLLNLCRDEIDAAARSGGDVALLNCTANYFSLAIVRNSKLIFFRCKSYVQDEGQAAGVHELLAREMGSSLSYYQEKLAGQAIGTMLVRTLTCSVEEIADLLNGSGIGRIAAIDPAKRVDLGRGSAIDAELGQRIAPAVGAAAGRGR